MDDKILIKRLFKFGHFYSPIALAVGEVKDKDLKNLTSNDAVVQAAVRSYQEWFEPQLSLLTMRSPEFGGHKRPAEPDGDAGPNTRELLTFPRCGMPDYLNPASGMEEANWPESCRNEITTSYRMSLTGISEDQLKALWLEGDGNWEKPFALQMPMRLGDYPNTRIHASRANLGGSVLADQYLAQNQCNIRLPGRFDNRTWSPVLLVTTITHEHGHGLGLNHLRDSQATMYPSITSASMARRGAPNGSDVEAMLRLGYKRREGPPPPPPGGDVTQSIALVCVLKDGKIINIRSTKVD